MKPKKTKPGTKVSPDKKTRAPNAISIWFDTHFRILSISVLVLAFLFRLSLFLELPEMPFNQLHKAKQLDMKFFDEWGDRIAGGDILTDTVLHPFHFWHKAIAESQGITDENAAKAKWNEWYGGKQYHQEPLYPLFVGFAKMITDNGRMLVYVLQMLLSLLSIWMVIWLGKHYFSSIAGVMGGLLFTFYGPGLLFDAFLLRTSLTTTLLLGSIVLAEQLISGRRKEWLMGFVGGASYLLMTTSILLWLPLVIRWLIVKPTAIRQVWKIGLVFSLFLSFLVYRNTITESPLLSASSVGPITYILCNFPGYQPEAGFVVFVTAGRLLDQTGGEMIPSALRIIELHKSIWSWIGLQFKKLGAVFHWYEVPNNVNTYLATEFSTTLKITFIPYSFIAALGLMGLFLNLKNKKTINLLMSILSQVAIMVIFYVLCRFRVPMVAMLCVYAGYTFQMLFNYQDIKKWILTFFGSILLLLFILRPWPAIPATYAEGELRTEFDLYYAPKLAELSARNDLQGCINEIEEFTKTMPSYLCDPVRLNTLESATQKDVANLYGLINADLANLYANTGNEAKRKATQALSDALIKASGRKKVKSEE